MPFLLKSKSRNYVIREGHGRDKRLLKVGPLKWVTFADLPPGMSSEGDKDISVVVIGGDRTIPDSEIEDTRVYETPAKADVADEPDTAQETGHIGISKRGKHRR